MYSLFENLAGGATIYDFMEWFDGVDESDVKAVLEFVARMEDVLDLYHEEYDPERPVVCFGRDLQAVARGCAASH